MLQDPVVRKCHMDAHNNPEKELIRVAEYL